MVLASGQRDRLPRAIDIVVNNLVWVHEIWQRILRPIM